MRPALLAGADDSLILRW